MQLNCNFDSLIVKIDNVDCQSAKTQKQRLLFFSSRLRGTREIFISRRHEVYRFNERWYYEKGENLVERSRCIAVWNVSRRRRRRTGTYLCGRASDERVW